MGDGMEKLSKLFGSEDRVKIMRLFLLNTEALFDRNEIRARCKVGLNSLRKEIHNLADVGFIGPKTVTVEGLRGRKKVEKWGINGKFTYLRPLKNLLFNVEVFKKEDVLRKIRETGQIKLIIVAGIFINNDDSRTDLFVVGDKINKRAFNSVVKDMESQIGRELNYGIMESEDYRYRLFVFDKFIRDILDYPHEVLLDKIESGK